MDNKKKPEENVQVKKEMRKQLADKIAAAIPELKKTLGEKKFEHRIKKAVKQITDGIHKKSKVTVVKKAKVAITPAPKKTATKKKAKAVKKSD